MSPHKLDPRLKGWLDQIIIPALVRDYLDEPVREAESLANKTLTLEDAEAGDEVLVEVKL